MAELGSADLNHLSIDSLFSSRKQVPAQPSPAQPSSGGSVGETDAPLQSAIVDTRRQQKLVITIMMLLVLVLGLGARMLIHNHFLTLMMVILVFMMWLLDITGHVGQWE